MNDLRVQAIFDPTGAESRMKAIQKGQDVFAAGEGGDADDEDVFAAG